MSGIQEILLIVAVIFGVLILPRYLPGNRPVKRKPRTVKVGLRIGIVLSALWLLLFTLYLQPWKGGLVLYVGLGPGVVALGWGVCWVVAGVIQGRKSAPRAE